MNSLPRSDFKAVPDRDDLAEIPRDLTYYPVNNPSPTTLSSEQVAQFDRDGFVRGIRIFEAAEIDEIRAYFDRLLGQVTAEGGNSYSISSAHLKYGRVWDILAEPRIVDRVADLLGEHVIGWGAHFFCKLPHDGRRVAFHQDSSYWPLTPSKAVTVWLAIDDADLENGCMRFIAGSHRFGHLTYRPSDPSEHNVLNQTVERPEQFGTPAVDELRAGEISIHSDLLLHGSDANDSDRRRCGLTLRYAPADVRAHLGWNEKGVHVRGTDSSGHWSNRPRPTTDIDG